MCNSRSVVFMYMEVTLHRNHKTNTVEIILVQLFTLESQYVILLLYHAYFYYLYVQEG